MWYSIDPKIVQQYYLGLRLTVHVYNVHCSGNEENLLNCTYSIYNPPPYYCSPYSDSVGVSCGKLAISKYQVA